VDYSEISQFCKREEAKKGALREEIKIIKSQQKK
jgi:hypothetical protein